MTERCEQYSYTVTIVSSKCFQQHANIADAFDAKQTNHENVSFAHCRNRWFDGTGICAPQQQYGAYELRRSYDRRIGHSLLLTLAGLALMLFLLVRISQTHLTDITSVTGDPTVTITDIPTAVPSKPQKPQNPPPGRLPKEIPTVIGIPDADSTEVDTTTMNSHQGAATGNASTDTTATGGNSGGTTAAVDSFVLASNRIETFAEVMPEFPGGMDALMSYLSKHIDCGEFWRESGSGGNVLFSLVVGKDGSVTDVKVLRDGVGFGCADQAMQVIKRMPKWKPGLQGKQPVNVQFVLPVTYQKL